MKWLKNRRLLAVIVVLFMFGLGIYLCIVFDEYNIQQELTQAINTVPPEPWEIDKQLVLKTKEAIAREEASKNPISPELQGWKLEEGDKPLAERTRNAIEREKASRNMVLPSELAEADKQILLEQEAKDALAHAKALAELYKLIEENPPAIVKKLHSDVDFIMTARITDTESMAILRLASKIDPVGVASEMIDNSAAYEEQPNFISRALEKDPKWVKGWLNRGHIRAYLLGDLTGGRSDMMKVVELSPNSNAAARAHTVLATIAMFEAEDLKKAGKDKEAEMKLEEGISEVKKANSISPDSGSYTTLADFYIAMGRNKEALKAANKAIKLNPNTQRAYHIRAQLEGR